MVGPKREEMGHNNNKSTQQKSEREILIKKCMNEEIYVLLLELAAVIEMIVFSVCVFAQKPKLLDSESKFNRLPIVSYFYDKKN